MPVVPAVTVKDFVVPAENPEYWPSAGSLTVSEGDDTSTSALTVHDEPDVGTLIVTLVPVVALDVEEVGVESVRHCDCAKAGADKTPAKASRKASVAAAFTVAALFFIDVSLLFAFTGLHFSFFIFFFF